MKLLNEYLYDGCLHKQNYKRWLDILLPLNTFPASRISYSNDDTIQIVKGINYINHKKGKRDPFTNIRIKIKFTYKEIQ